MSRLQSRYYALFGLTVVFALVLAPLWSLHLASRAAAASDLVVYDDALAAGWENWSWDTTADFESTTQVHSGTKAIAVTHTAAWAGLSLRAATPVNTAGYAAIAFWVYGGAGGSQLTVNTQATDDGDVSASFDITAPAGVWTAITVPLTDLGSPAQLARINPTGVLPR
jgi:hypothetical protein